MRSTDYEPSQSEGPDGPRNNEKQLRDIANNTASFAGHEPHNYAEDTISRGEAIDAVENIKAEKPVTVEDDVNSQGDDDGLDPFDPANTAVFNFIATMRTYDVLMALLNHFDHDVATNLSEIHNNGKLITDIPYLG